MSLQDNVTDARLLRVVIKQLHEMCQLCLREQAEGRALRALELVDRMEDRIDGLNVANAKLLQQLRSKQMLLDFDLALEDGIADNLPAPLQSSGA